MPNGRNGMNAASDVLRLRERLDQAISRANLPEKIFR
jgi:hypothetical protein